MPDVMADPKAPTAHGNRARIRFDPDAWTAMETQYKKLPMAAIVNMAVESPAVDFLFQFFKI